MLKLHFEDPGGYDIYFSRNKVEFSKKTELGTVGSSQRAVKGSGKRASLRKRGLCVEFLSGAAKDLSLIVYRRNESTKKVSVSAL